MIFKPYWAKVLVIVLVVLAGIFVLPWDRVNWGKFEVLPGSSLTVTGEAHLDTLPQVARFSATVSVTDADKEVAVDQVNSNMADLIDSLKSFGIADEDLQTREISVYQTDGEVEIMIYPPRPRTGNQWQASNTVEIKLKNIDRAGELADLLASSGATSVSGPNFSLDDTADYDSQLLEQAIADAREKAQAAAKASGRRLGKVLTVSESGVGPIYRGLEVVSDQTATPIEPGRERLSKTVSVTFELK
ncbi:MAG: hypothetical protein UX85_C0001G0185 [Candidatus Beckwithbacteria bacterium GW2011_GWB1_47_15]|uniref:26 kDa periplasmic immunogenic protein n=1 Tax=Candidatus Beckwithbacteria bacterium GW2011_GWB1_47_15 TaxID=1618371 RepID=A0A0G1RXY0_9BACT|nr:MAG: hypothetical protein UY43_C0001G0941 [Candidatus Beckwithbacteria bacterium GW2011_GWC1_49_16]AQS30822.1 hypothetical protein [uncultured bacterium]KKU36007.1 MAG: hypothetical protein UX50_C0001G0184 [Candidatus Beckwithbacteria bacterium GW2011_GWA1_46_30]KKU61971.1 MAG: hypothetical protein UX85_C0001G0185 [Candidatus Beckwithbacteria bacterium GW2011_GWB1_47_15]KKU72475.1 MAG: hypothetical protein UX97_C0001G0345 [Candidatus Beckwithbacteria bacterium GW2011_GWA2_47_25]KKW04358.1 M